MTWWKRAFKLSCFWIILVALVYEVGNMYISATGPRIDPALLRNQPNHQLTLEEQAEWLSVTEFPVGVLGVARICGWSYKRRNKFTEKTDKRKSTAASKGKG